MPGLPPLTVVPLFPLILLCPLSRSGFVFIFLFFFAFCFVTVGVYLHESVVVAFNFLHGVLFMIAKLPCSSGRQGAGRGCVEGHRKQCQSGWESRWCHFRSLSVAFG